jgi:predicted dehydrogenase
MQPSISRILLVGYGSIGKRYIKIINKQYPKISIILMRHKKYSDQLKINGIDYCVSSIDEALTYDPKAAIIANPASYHLDTAIPLANAGLHLLIEKPLSINSLGLDRLLNICSKNDLILMTGYNLRFLPSLQEFRKNLDSNIIGRALSVRVEVGQYLPNWRPESDYRESVSAQKILGGGVLLELCHEIDYLLWLFGRVEWVNAYTSKQSKLEIDVEDTAYVILGFKRDMKDFQITASLNMDFIRHDSSRSCTVICEEGSLKWDGIKGTVEVFKKNENKWSTIFYDQPEKNFTYEEELQHFFKSIKKTKNLLSTGEDGMLTLNVIDAIRMSHKNSRLVYIQEFDGDNS